jgi:hypothetical protein
MPDVRATDPGASVEILIDDDGEEDRASAAHLDEEEAGAYPSEEEIMKTLSVAAMLRSSRAAQ